MIPADAAEQIAAKATFESLDRALIQHETEIVGYPILPLVEQLSKTCGEAGRYVHWGATTQDILDTAVVLQVRADQGLEVNQRQLADNLENALLMATVLNPVLDYDRVAQITRKAAQEGLSPKAATVALGLVTAEDYDRLVRPELMVAPGL